ncbi:MAG: hypothetical protein ACRCYQ_14950 [Nocardioides sp.]
MGTLPQYRRRGLARATISAGLPTVDHSRLAAWLETDTDTNVELYRSLGFEVTAPIARTDNGPEAWAMVRPAYGEPDEARGGHGQVSRSVR